MKKFFFFIILLILSGCMVVNDESLVKELDADFASLETIASHRQNNVMVYYDYYLPSAMAEEELDSESVVLRYNESKVIMNLNISNIINQEIYPEMLMQDEGFFNSDYLIYENKGEYSIEETSKQYLYRLYKYEGSYLLHLLTSDMNYYGVVEISDLNILTKYLLLMMKNVSINYEQVVADYANTNIIEYTKKQIDLFDTSMPVSGELNSLLIDGAIIGDQVLPQDGQIEESENNNSVPIE